MNNNQKAADLLDAAADLLTTPGAWTKGKLARASTGYPCAPDSPRAVCWCATGALLRVNPGGESFILALGALYELIGHISDWNDHPRRKQGDVVQLLRRAANKLRSAP